MAEMRSFIGKHGLKLLLTISVTFLLVFMILPILDMFTKSVVDDNGFTWSYFKEFFSKSLYAKILLNTIRLSLIIGLVTIVLGYPVAYLMNRVGPVLRCIIMGCVQIPFWTSLLVRTYSWIAILQNQGVVNVVLQKLGIIKQPIQLLYNDAGVIIVMTYIMLPYMIFSISSVMGQIDKNVIIASRSLGAGKTMTFFPHFFTTFTSGNYVWFLYCISEYNGILYRAGIGWRTEKPAPRFSARRGGAQSNSGYSGARGSGPAPAWPVHTKAASAPGAPAGRAPPR